MRIFSPLKSAGVLSGLDRALEYLLGCCGIAGFFGLTANLDLALAGGIKHYELNLVIVG